MVTFRLQLLEYISNEQFHKPAIYSTIVQCLRKFPHLIAEFYWSLYLCKQVITKLQQNLQMVSQ